METLQLPLSQIEQYIANNLNNADYAIQFQKHKMLVVDHFLPSQLVQELFCPEIENCVPYIHRVNIKTFKKSGSTGSHILSQYAPNLFSLYCMPSMKLLIEKIVGEPLQYCPKNDLHAAALYHYTEPGDYIGVHYDKSFYRGRRYTVLLGLIQDSVSSNLICYPGANKLQRRKNPITVFTHPGTLVIFDGDVLWHEVTPLAANERRVILTMEFVTDPRMTVINRLLSNFKDKILYFGK